MAEPAKAVATVLSVEPSSTLGSAPATPTKAQRRKGQPAKYRDAEKFRTNKNKVFDKTKQITLKDKLLQSVSSEVMFGIPRILTTRPAQQFTISTKYLIQLCTSLIEIYRAGCKVMIDRDDLPALVTATTMQLEAKIWHARQASPFAIMEEEVERRARRVRAVLPDALFPISYYLDQIGLIDFEHQHFIPKLYDLSYDTLSVHAGHLGIGSLPPGVIPLEVGNALTGARQWARIVNQNRLIEIGALVLEHGRIRFSDAFLLDPNQFAWVGNLRLDPWQDVLPTFDEVVNRYNSLIGRVVRRVPDCKYPVDYTNARGTAAQLVTAEEMNDVTSVQVWSNRYIDDESLTVGALLRFGQDMLDVDESHNRDFLCVESVVETAGATERFMRNVVNRLR